MANTAFVGHYVSLHYVNSQFDCKTETFKWMNPNYVLVFSPNLLFRHMIMTLLMVMHVTESCVLDIKQQPLLTLKKPLLMEEHTH